ncbi:MAG: glycoside hydrolase family 9 protein [Steroidobacteraceae bacterium]
MRASRLVPGAAVLCLVATTGSAAAAPAAPVEVLGDRALRIDVAGLDPRTCCSDPRDVVVVPASGRGAAPIGVARIGVDRQVTSLPATPSNAVATTRISVWLERPLEPHRRYVVRVPGRGVEASATYDPGARTSAIAVNQLGYAPLSRKVALVGEWLGTAGPMPVDAGEFDLVDSVGHPVFHGPLVLRARADPWSGNDVYVADFSAVQRPGRYRVRVPGYGVSDEFGIRDDVYRDAYRTVLRVLYHQRNSTPIDARHAAPGYARAEGVPSRFDAVFDVAVSPSPLGNHEAAGSHHPLRGGWFDAGDYGQYVVNAAPVWFCVGLGFDLAPTQFRDGDLDIPESGNGTPDVLDELDWGFSWLLSMQDARDGGVYSRVASERWDEGLPAHVTAPRLIAEKTTHATASFAAAAAIHARLMRDRSPERSAAALSAARLAWRFLVSHPQWPAEGERYRNRPGMHAGEYADSSAFDNRMWAAAELLRSTGDAQYLEDFERNFPQLKLDPTGEVTYSEQGMAAAWAYLASNDPRRNATIVAAARRAVLAGADWRIRQMEASPWLAPSHPRRSLTGWGNFAQSSRAALTLLQAHRLSGQRRYLEWAWVAPGAELGLNPQGLTYVTGLGARSPRHPLSKLSQHSGAGAPLPGLPVNGPHARLPGAWPSTRAVTAAYWPDALDDGTGPDGGDGYPVLRRYTDSDQLPPMSEPTVAEVARVGIALALLSDGAALAPRPDQQ